MVRLLFPNTPQKLTLLDKFVSDHLQAHLPRKLSLTKSQIKNNCLSSVVSLAKTHCLEQKEASMVFNRNFYICPLHSCSTRILFNSSFSFVLVSSFRSSKNHVTFFYTYQKSNCRLGNIADFGCIISDIVCITCDRGLRKRHLSLPQPCLNLSGTTFPV